MAEVEERVASLEAKNCEVTNQGTKIDKLMDLVSEIKLNIISMKNDVVSKDECKVKHVDCNSRIEAIEKGQKQLFLAIVTTGFALIVWLLEQLLHITLKIG